MSNQKTLCHSWNECWCQKGEDINIRKSFRKIKWVSSYAFSRQGKWSLYNFTVCGIESTELLEYVFEKTISVMMQTCCYFPKISQQTYFSTVSLRMEIIMSFPEKIGCNWVSLPPYKSSLGFLQQARNIAFFTALARIIWQEEWHRMHRSEALSAGCIMDMIWIANHSIDSESEVRYWVIQWRYCEKRPGVYTDFRHVSVRRLL